MLKQNIFLISIILMLLFVTASAVSAAEDNSTDEITAYDDCTIDEVLNDELENANDENPELENCDEEILEDEGLLDATEAYECLNEYRAEKGVWYWNGDDATVTYFNTNEYNQLQPLERDPDLEAAAKIRAKDISELFEHTRPNGDECFAIYPTDYWMRGENIAISSSAKEATEAWKEDFLPYEEQGHRRNMLSPYFTSVGIAGYEKDGVQYWIQAFGAKFDYNPPEQEIPMDSSKGSFSDLNILIENSTEILLEKDYAYNNCSNFTYGIIINRTMTIDGAGHSIDGQKLKRALVVLADNVVLKNIKFINGEMNYGLGGAIYSEGNNLTFINCSFIENGGYYGSIYSANGSLSFIDCIFEDNYNVEGTVYTNGSNASFKNCKLKNNTAILYGGALSLNTCDFSITDCSFIANAGYKGSAVSSSNSRLRVKNSDFSRNHGTIYGTLSLNNVDATFEDSDFTNNTVAALANVFGGAIILDKGNMSIMTCNFNNNTGNAPHSNGGAVYANEAEVSILNCNFTNNRANAYGGAVCSNEGNIAVENSNFVNNSAGPSYFTTYGGAVFAGYGNASVKNCDFADNFASIYGGAVSFSDANGIILNCNFHNDTSETHGGAVNCENGDYNITNCNFNNEKSYYGGAVYLGYGKAKLMNCNFNDNLANICAGAAYLIEGNFTILDCSFKNNSLNSDYSSDGSAIFSTRANIILENCALTDNHAEEGYYNNRGGALHLFNTTASIIDCHFANNTAMQGGAIFSNYGSLYLKDCDICNATAISAGAIFSMNANVSAQDCSFINLAVNSYGAIYLASGNLCLNNTNFTNNTAIGLSSAVYCDASNASVIDSNFKDNSLTSDNSDDGALNLNGGDFTVVNSNFINNIGGAISSNNGDATLKKCSFINNCLNTKNYYAYGGAINSNYGNLTIEDSIFANNFVNSTYEANGGAIYANNGNATLLRCSFNDNYAFSGASLYSNSANINVDDCQFINETSFSGSALSATNSNISVSNSYFINDIADYYGSAIYSSQSEISIKDSNFINDSAYMGGAIYSYEGYGFISSCLFENNTANYAGGALYSSNGNMDLLNCNLTGNHADYGGAAYGCNAVNSIFAENSATYRAGAIFGVNNTASKCSFIKNTASSDNPTFNMTTTGSTFTGNKLIVKAFFYIPESSTRYNGEYFYIELYATNYEPVTNATVTVRVYKDNTLQDTLNCQANQYWRIILDEGIYDVQFSVENQDFVVDPANMTLTVLEREIAVINATVTNDTYLKPTFVDIISNVAGDVYVYIDGAFTEYVTVSANRTSQITLYNIAAGKHRITASLIPTDSNIDQTYIETGFEVSRKETSISLDVKNTTKSKNIIVNVKASESGNAVVKLGSITRNVNVNANENTPVDFGLLNCGTYDVEATFSAGDNYIDSHASKSVTVFDEITQDAVKVTIPEGNSSDISISIPSDAKGTVTLSIAGDDYTANVENGAADVKLPVLADGNYDYTITYSGDDKYGAFNITGSVKMGSSADITIKPDIEVPKLDEKNTEIRLPEDATGTVTLNINGEDYVFDVVNGISDIELPKLKNGNYEYTITYSGDGKYSSFAQSGSTAVDNPIIPVITAKNLKTTYLFKPYYSIKVTNADSDVIVDENVVITLNDKAFKTIKTNANGIVKFKVTQAPGTYKVAIKVLGKTTKKTLTVKHLLTLKTVKVKKSAKKLVLTATLGKVNKKYLKGKKITFKFNGKKYTAKTNKKGVAKVTIKVKVLKKLKVNKKVTYQATYLKDTVKKTAKVKK